MHTSMARSQEREVSSFTVSLVERISILRVPSAMERKHHAVLIPYPTQGHINPLLQLAKLLHSRGLCITFVITDYVHHCLLRSGFNHPLRGQDGFRLEVVPDGLPLSGRTGMEYIRDITIAITTTFVTAVRERIAKLQGEDGVPPITCMISGLIGPVLKVAEEIGVPGLLFWTTSACGFMSTLYVKEIIERGYLPFEGIDESCGTKSNYLDAIIDWIPGLKQLRLRDMSTFFDTRDRNDYQLDFDQAATMWASRASGVILNTFDELELEAVVAMKQKFRKLYTVGPLTAITDHTAPSKYLGSLQLSLWKGDRGCISWLDNQKAGSVLYINFGSIIVLEGRQLMELAWGVAASGHPFLWVIRPDLVAGDSSGVSLEEILEETRSRSFITSWCPQEEVIAHPSVGGFLTHAGWNSMLESIRRGVPMLCRPFFADQPVNCRYACDEWGVGMEIEGEMERGRVEDLVRELMGGVKGKELRKNSSKWRKKAEVAACDRRSSSNRSMEALVRDCCNLSTLVDGKNVYKSKL